ncbi:MAG: bifunctional nuclease family protein [Coriobacteriia bacterium]|nr:bifunctional nuclease family protein [Coriobacteriia bacterium]MCL2750302.1 bifunctional nuclease family protein [Coriobacteriia bacterium]
MVEVNIFTVVVAHPDSPSVVVLVEKGAVSQIFGAVRSAESKDAGETIQNDARNQEIAAGQKDINDLLAVDAIEGTDLIAPQLLPIWIGHSEAEAIVLLLNNQSHSRPLTHDLLANVIGVLGTKVERVIIDKVAGSTFYATVCLNKDGRLIQVDARPSDSIALALKTGARIFIDKDVMNAAAHQVRVKVSDGGELLYGSEDEMERFHSFIESISPEDFMV